MKWIRDEEFIRGNIPMTKFDARVIALAMLEVGREDTFVDIGAGTGSLSIQAALLGAKVYALEREEEGIRLIKENSAKFNAELRIVHGSAPETLASVNCFNKCFIGGSGGRIEEITEEADKRLSSGGMLAASFIVPDNMVRLKQLLKEKRYSEIEVRLVQSSVIDRTGLMKANNPIFLIKGKKL